MGRPKGGTNKKYPYELKLKVVLEHENDHISYGDLEKRYDVVDSVIRRWIKNYYDGCLKEGRSHNRGNKFAALHASKHLTNEQRLELENLKLRIENERLKKGYLVKGSGANKEYVSILDPNMKSSKN